MTQRVHLPILNWTMPVHFEGLPYTLTSIPTKELEDSSEGLQLNFIVDGVTGIPGPECSTRKAQPAIKNQNVLAQQIFPFSKTASELTNCIVYIYSA